MPENDRTLLNKMSLKFSNIKMEKQYIESTRENNRHHNICVSLLSSILSFTTAILFIFSYILVKRQADKNNLIIEQVDNKTMISLIKNNQTTISSKFLFKDKYLLINGTMLNLGYSKEESLISNSEEMINFLSSTFFLNIGMLFTNFLFFFYIFFLIGSYLTKKDNFQKIIFCGSKFFFSQTFTFYQELYLCISKFNLRLFTF